jgi:hypothetical protein
MNCYCITKNNDCYNCFIKDRKILAENGNSDAQYDIGEYYYYNVEDIEKAMIW